MSCLCGCGEPTTIAKQSHTQYGWTKGLPKPYKRGHYGRGIHRGGAPSGTLVDPEDAWLLTAYTWSLQTKGYVYRPVVVDGRKSIELLHHRIIGKPSHGLQTDHINRNKLDNRRSNLRHVTPSENSRNRGKCAA